MPNTHNLEIHTPVLLKEVLQIFDPKPGEIYIDATVNGGGHARRILNRVGPNGKVIGIDWDPGLITELEKRKKEEHLNGLTLIHGSFANLESYGESEKGKINGILFDLGYSSYHIEKAGRGFSFHRDEPLDMRYDPHGTDLTAEKIINTWAEDAIEDVFRSYGEERFSKRIARRIVTERKEHKIRTTAELRRIIERIIPRRPAQKIHQATRVFQALRIAVNSEIGNIEKGLEGAWSLLADKGKIIVISFHSLEDRIIKNFFKKRALDGEIRIITKKPLQPQDEEIQKNHRARSAKLRAAEKHMSS